MEIVYYETLPDLDTYFELRRSVDWKNKLLWMIGEVGEVIDIVKKHGPEASNADNPEREHLIEELADVLMYYNDVLLCYGITAEELKDTYTNKFEKNMKRW